ncbi:MAG: response regulator [Proteobacteria bacterium]|nr:response regulator [Desulfobacula sp.]MBU3954189.1 response regulator [Pseudomonadota bacterium]MBU4129571.1 response regulator [Pseudomonadota bacterium]
MKNIEKMKHTDILIIDDEIKFAAMLSKRIQLRGYHSEICHDGKTALGWLKTHGTAVTLILLDLQLPDMYGTQVLTQIKMSHPDIPVIILTGHGTEQDRQECEQLGAYLFIHKPLDIDQLMTLLEKIRETS